MPDQLITCPKCMQKFELTDSVFQPLLLEAQKQIQEAADKREASLNRKAEELAKLARTLEQSEATIDERVAEEVRSERKRIAEEEKEKAARANLLVIQDLQTQIEEQGDKLDEAKQNELDLRAQQRKLKEDKEHWDLEMARKLDEERDSLLAKAKSDVKDDYDLKLQQKDTQMESLRKQIDDLKAKAEQGSQQAQGDAPEVILEAELQKRFPQDQITRVPKGQHGGDIIHCVMGASGSECGTILWESKRTKGWQEGWLQKLREDQRAAKAEIAIIMTWSLPKDISEGFGFKDGVWVTDFTCAYALAFALREQLTAVSVQRQRQEGMQTKAGLIYEYICSNSFKHHVQAIAESFKSLKDDIQSEKTAMERIWNKREKQMMQALKHTAQMYGDLEGISGQALPEIAALDLKAIGAPAEPIPPIVEVVLGSIPAVQ